MESNTHCSDIKYFYLELLAFYVILIGLSGELFWNKGISKHVLHKEIANNKKASKICLPYTLSYQHIINLRQWFYKHRLDDKTIERIKELGLKRKLRGSRVVEIRLEHGPQTRGFTNTCSEHCLNVK